MADNREASFTVTGAGRIIKSVRRVETTPPNEVPPLAGQPPAYPRGLFPVLVKASAGSDGTYTKAK
jgi:hypothetical protein